MWTFDSAGRLSAQTDRNGNTITYHYGDGYASAGQLTTVTDTRGRDLTLSGVSTSGGPRVSGISDWTGRSWT